MARSLRIDFPDAYHHVTARGVMGHDIFHTGEDRQFFLSRLAEAHQRWEIVVYGYCLMSNHVHLELRTPRGELSRAMQWVMQSHAARMNRAHGRAGHLFQGRFRSVLVEADSHLHELTRYIHLNPVRAGLVRRPEDYEWSSYRAYVGLADRPAWLDISATLSRFGPTRAGQVSRYEAFVRSSLPEDPVRQAAFGAILGTPAFVERVRRVLSDRAADPEVSGLRRARPQPSLATLFRAAARSYGVSLKALRCKSKRRNEARDVAVYLARHGWGLPLREIGEFVGGLGLAAVSLADRRISERLPDDAPLRRRVAALERQLAEVDAAPAGEKT
jgi:REP element-mobilizing transposase RayT